MFLEYGLLNMFGVDNPRCDYISTYILTTCIFVLLLKIDQWNPLNITIIGRDFSMWIYILHMSLLGLVKRLPLLFIKPLWLYDVMRVCVAYVLCLFITRIGYWAVNAIKIVKK